MTLILWYLSANSLFTCQPFAYLKNVFQTFTISFSFHYPGRRSDERARSVLRRQTIEQSYRRLRMRFCEQTHEQNQMWHPSLLTGNWGAKEHVIWLQHNSHKLSAKLREHELKINFILRKHRVAHSSLDFDQQCFMLNSWT